MAVPALPITDAQQELLVADGSVRHCQALHRIIRFDLDPGLSAETLTSALAELVTVQPALRQVFAFVPEPHAVLAAPPQPSDIPLERIDAAPAEYAAALAELVDRLRGRPFELSRGPAYRFGHVRTTDHSSAALLLCQHHIVGDESAAAPIARDLEVALTVGRPPAESATLRHEREAAFLRELNAHDRAATAALTAGHVQSWAERLRDIPPLVLDPRPGRPTETDGFGARISAELNAAEAASLDATCQRLDLSPYTLLTAMFGAVLARHGSVSTVLVGSPVTVRRTPAGVDLAGHFTNSLPIIVEVDWSARVDEYLGRTVREAVDYGLAHVDVTHEQLVDQLNDDVVDHAAPLFAAALIMDEAASDIAGQAVLRACAVPAGTVTHDVCLTVRPVDGRWLLELDHDRRLISAAAADGLLDSLRMALRRALADGSRPLGDVFTDVPAATSPAAFVRPPVGGLAEWIDNTARLTPNAVAVEEVHRTLTYHELATEAARAADGLLRRGTSPGDIVGLALDGLCDTVTAMLAVLRVGGTCLPLDTSLPWERLARMSDLADSRLIIGHGVNLPGATTVRLAELTGPGDDLGADVDARTGGDSRFPVYLMFTSGSTGQPKGVLMGHGALLNLAAWQITALEHDAETRFLQYSPLSFDVSFQEIFPTLAAGGTVVSREPVDRRDFPALVHRIANCELTHIFLPVAALRPFVAAARGSGIDFPALRRVCVSGEQLLVDEEIRRFFVDHPRCALINLYGPTETNAATVHRLDADQADWSAHVPIGRPLPGVAAHVVDQTGHLAPVGVPGELYLGGVGPADGYLDDEQTSKSFLPDRFSGVQNARMYRTGDLVVRTADETLVFLGRQDTQLKIRGYRVELGEIETVAGAADGVRQAVAVARGAGSDRELVLFLLAADGAEPDHAAVRARLGDALPPYMVPNWIFDTESIPTSRTGKTDRNSLVELADQLIADDQGQPYAVRAHYADELERELADIWAAVLATNGIGRDQSLLDHGAHSLNIITAFTQIRERYGAIVPVPDFFRSPTIAMLAELVRGNSDRTAAAE
jgi:amino acid adenylation domain-containing protein